MIPQASGSSNGSAGSRYRYFAVFNGGTFERIRVEVSSSNFPRFDRNLNTGGNNYDETRGVVATNLIHHAAGRASHILLPVVP